LKYWRDEEYIGVGLSAHSYYLGKRFYNTDSFFEYSDDFGIKYRKEESSTDGIDPFEYAMLRLRLCEGLSLSEYLQIFKRPFAQGKEDLIKYYVENGFMKIDDGRISFTYKGFYVSNTILGELI
jgi:oxygen-independent coproporphyrinogen-3 oxidase